LLAGENQENLYLCTYNSAFLTKAAHGGFFASLRRRRKPLKSRRDERPQTGVVTPGTSALTKLSPERAIEYITCLISNCLNLCRPFRTFHVVAQLPGVLPFGQAQAESTPVCGLSRLDFVDLWFGAYLPDTNKRKFPFSHRSWNAAAGTEP